MGHPHTVDREYMHMSESVPKQGGSLEGQPRLPTMTWIWDFAAGGAEGGVHQAGGADIALECGAE